MGSPRELHMTLIETRDRQMFPVLEHAQIETVKRFASGPAREFPPAETVYKPG
jgi:thioredoxin reductase (NADPH)